MTKLLILSHITVQNNLPLKYEAVCVPIQNNLPLKSKAACVLLGPHSVYFAKASFAPVKKFSFTTYLSHPSFNTSFATPAFCAGFHGHQF